VRWEEHEDGVLLDDVIIGRCRTTPFDTDVVECATQSVGQLVEERILIWRHHKDNPGRHDSIVADLACLAPLPDRLGG
jgi:hypothetical protein